VRLGILLIFMWVGTDHSMTKSNYNLLWAWPFNVIIAFFINSNKKWVKNYTGFSALGLTIVLLTWLLFTTANEQCINSTCPLLIFISGRKYFTTVIIKCWYKLNISYP
jgi:hypothetical protein